MYQSFVETGYKELPKMICLTMEVRGVEDKETGDFHPEEIEHFIKIKPKSDFKSKSADSIRDGIHKEINNAVSRRFGPEARLLHVCGTYNSPDLTLIFLVSGGTAVATAATMAVVGGAYKFIKDYPDLRQGIILLTKDIRAIITKLSPHVEVNEKYPPEVGGAVASSGIPYY